MNYRALFVRNGVRTAPSEIDPVLLTGLYIEYYASCADFTRIWSDNSDYVINYLRIPLVETGLHCDGDRNAIPYAVTRWILR